MTEWLTMFEHEIDCARDLMRGCHNRLLRAVPRSQATKEGPIGRVSLAHRLGGQAKGLTSAIAGFENVTPQNLPTRLVLVRCQTQPRTEMLVILPAPHVGSDFGDNRQGGRLVQSSHSDQIHSQQLVKLAAHI